MVAANVGITLLPVLAVKPPVAHSTDIDLIEFRGHPPSRRIAMVWRKSSAMAIFLMALADIFRKLPRKLLDPPSRANRKAAKTAKMTRPKSR